MDGQNEIKEIDRLILKYLEGEASKDEKIELYRWIELSEENKTHFKEAQELWLSTQAIRSNLFFYSNPENSKKKKDNNPFSFK